MGKATEAPMCKVCKMRHRGPDHVFATNADDATNGEPSNATNRTANRRGRDAYNAYQREYMRRRRAKLGRGL